MPALQHSLRLAQGSSDAPGDEQGLALTLWVEITQLFRLGNSSRSSHPALPGGRRALCLSLGDSELSSAEQEHRAAPQTLPRLLFHLLWWCWAVHSLPGVQILQLPPCAVLMALSCSAWALLRACALTDPSTQLSA